MSLQITWAHPDQEYRNGIIREYHVEINEADTNMPAGYYIVSNTQIGVADLHPYYLYNCTIAAYTVGKGPISSGVLIRTFQDGMLD